MGTLFGFVVGYIVGARAGHEGFDRLQQAFNDIRQSREFRDFVTALRGHARSTLQAVSERLEGDGSAAASVEDLLARAQSRLGSESSSGDTATTTDSQPPADSPTDPPPDPAADPD